MDKARQTKVAAMDAHQCDGGVADGLRVIANIGAVGRAHLHQGGTALPHHVGDPKTAADFYQLAARDDDFPAAGKGHQDKEQGGGVVIDHQSRLSSGQPAEEVFSVHIA